jgi:hypothetical protein
VSVQSLEHNYLDASRELIASGKTFPAFILLYITVELQLRKLVTFALRTDPHSIHWNHICSYMQQKNDFDSLKWIEEFNRLHSSEEFHEILTKKLGNDKQEFRKRKKRLESLRTLRNNIFHGKIVSKEQYRLFYKDKPNEFLINWIELVANAMEETIGYNGLDNLRHNPKVKKCEYQFNKVRSFEDVSSYLKQFANKPRNAK